MYGLYTNRWFFPPSRNATKLSLPKTPPNLFLFSFHFFYNSISPNNPISFDFLLKSCNSLEPLKQIHSSLSTTGFILSNPQLGAQLITKYSKFGDTDAARSLFDAIKGCNSFLWNTMIRAYANVGHCNETLELYSVMHRMGIRSNNYTYPFVLKACATKSLVFGGKSVHLDVIRNGFDSDAFVEAALVDMYAKCGEIDDGRRVFDEMSKRDLVCWTAMITGYEQADRAAESLVLLSEMQQEGLVADSVTAVSVASAVGQLGDVQKSRSVHAHVIRNGFLEDLIVANSIIAMYAKCGDVKAARIAFDGMKVKDGISWNSLLSGYAQNGFATEALLLFEQMRVSTVQPNPVTALIVVSACAYLGSLHIGRKVHSFIVSGRMKIDTTLWNAIIDMYAKCGDLETAIQVFDNGHESGRNVSSWNVMISGYGMHGHGKEALHLFSRMQEEGVEPNHITFTCILSACSHAGLVDEGRKCFYDLRKKFFTKPTVKHYACMVDLLGRAGHLEEAQALIAEMPSEANDGVWGALLGACRIHRNAELGQFAAKNLFRLEPEHSGYYVLMSNIYAASNQWHEVGKLRQVMKSRGLKKPAAFSVIEFRKEVHGFHTADQTHPEWMEVYRKVEILAIEMKMAGHVPDTSCVLHDVEEEDKEHILNYHSEKLAVAFGIMKMDEGIPIQVTKNLRVCHDCHSAFKFISYVHKRKIVVRDANRFHHFQDGCCSCKDYW
ncbi:pentatricopeptide repeat-containing protein At3g26782, mitochondrial-like [Magnolia sinica]|uniref:pentatricopeptide repeat-containing protein At3g26782, mitochondrial-like n=1 Tax=Magnolia sinica TaxID=86752 RepID=UPI00265830FF|nr:pentatricopeptide repeat-containing protein At3g26782, mitochondrial-like [Magnolia sinica]